MEITPRIKEILLLVLNADHPVMEQNIADSIGVSKRTVQREFDYLKNALHVYNLDLYKKKNQGVQLLGSNSDKAVLKNDIENACTDGIVDKERRRKYLIIKLLNQSEPQKLFYYSTLLGVSEATISGDLDSIEEWLNQNHIEIVRKPGYGVVLNGSEKNYRSALQRFINENIADKEIKQLLKRGCSANVLSTEIERSKNMYDLLNGDVLGKVSRLFSQMNEQRLNQMTDDSYIGLILHITVALDRIFKGEIIEENPKVSKSLLSDPDYDLAKTIIESLENEFSIQIPEVELSYILLHIKGSKMHYSQNSYEENAIQAKQLLDIADALIDSFDPEYSCELKNDEEFVHGLILHLKPTFIRLKNDMNIFNPILQDIKTEYREIFEKCKKASSVITKMTGFTVSDEEVGYLAVHFGAAVSRIQKQFEFTRTVIIGVICASGFGVARLMLTKIQNRLGKQAELIAYGKDEVTDAIKERTDFFISSMNVDSLEVDYVQISPLVTVQDLQQIEVKVESYSHLPAKASDSDFTRQLDEVNQMSAIIKKLIQNYRQFVVSENISFEELISTISEQAAKTDAASALLKADLFAREKVMSQIFPEMEFALFHCRTKAVKEPSVFTCVPESGEHFIHPELKNIKAAIILLMPIDSQRELNSEILGYISSSLIEQPSMLSAIFNGEETSVREQLQSILRLYFTEYMRKI